MTPVFCFFNSTPTWGGGEKWHYEMALFLMSKQYRVIFFLSPGSVLESKLSDASIRKITIKVNQFSFLNRKKVKLVEETLREEKISHLVINSSEDLKLAGLASSRARTPHVIYRRGSAIPIKNKFSNRYIFKNFIHHIIANSEATKQTILQKNADLFPQENIRVIYNGIDTTEYVSRPFETLYNKNEDEIVIGNAGRLVEQKGQADLIDIAVRLKAKGKKFKILIAGSGKLEDELKTLAAQNGVENEIIFLGFVENIKSVMESVDIFVLTSRWEGFGYVLAEAALSAKPVVAYNSSSNPEIVADSKTGLLCQAGNTDEMANRLLTLIDDGELRTQLGNEGRRWAENNFDQTKQAKKTEEFLIGL